MEHIVHENDGAGKGVDGADLVGQGRVVRVGLDGIGAEVRLVDLVGTQGLGDGVGHGHAAEDLAVGDADIRAEDAGRGGLRGDAVAAGDTLEQPVVNDAGGQAEHQRSGLQLCQRRLQAAVGGGDGGKHTGRGAEGRLHRGVHVAAEDDGAAHIHGQGVRAVTSRDEALERQQLAAVAGDGALQGKVEGIGELTAEGQGQHLGDEQLAEVALALAPGHEQPADEQGAAAGVLADQTGEGRVAQAGEEAGGVQAGVAGRAQNGAVGVPADHHVVAAALDLRPQRRGGGHGEHGAEEFLRRLRRGGQEAQVLGAENGLVLGLAEVQAAAIDELLHRGIDEVGDVAVGIHRLADAGGADLLQLGRERQLQHLAGDAAVIRRLGVRLGAAEDHVVEGVDGVRRDGLFVGRGVEHHVAAHHDGHAAAREGGAQLVEVLRVGDVHREVLREDADVEHVGHGHGGDAPAQAVGLGLFGPGELVNGQQDLEALVADGPDDALVGQGEGVEGAGEEGHGAGRTEVKALVEQALLGDEAVELAQHGGPVVERQALAGEFVLGGEQLALGEHKGAALFVAAQLSGAEDPAAQHEQGLLPGGAVNAAEAPHQQAQQPFTAAAVGVVRLREAGAIGIVRLIDDTHGIQHGGGNAAVGGAEVHAKVVQHLIQLRRGQPQGKTAQVVGDILGELLLAQLQAAAQLHRHLVALVGRQSGRQGQQGVAGAVADGDAVTDLDEIGQVGGDMEGGAFAAAGKVRQQAQVALLGDPGGGGLQVVQEDLGDHVLRQKKGRALREHILLEIAQGAAVAVGDGGHGLQRAAVLRVQAGETVQQQHGGHADGQVLTQGQGGGEVRHLPGAAGRIGRIRQSGGGIQQLEGGVVVQILRPAVVGEHRGQEALLPAGAVAQQGADGEFQGIADPAAVLGHELMVGIQYLVQIEPPLVHVGDGPGVRADVGGALLGVAGVEAGDDLAQQRRRLTADIALAVHQQLVEERQGLDLLWDMQIEGVGLHHRQISAETAPIRLAAGLLQQTGEAALIGEAVHQLHIVAHAAERQGAEGLVVGHKGGVLLRQRGRIAAGHGDIHAAADHELLKVLQPGVDPGIALLLLAVHVVQLVQDHLEGLGQSGDTCDLPALRIVELLDAEVGVDQQQRLHGEVVGLQVPDGVVGGHVADIGHPAAAEPLVGVEIVQVGHALAGAAAELAQIVAGGGAGDQGHVHGHAAFPQGAGGGDGDVVDAGDMLKGAVGRDLQAQTHQLIDELPPPQAQEALIGRGTGTAGQLIIGQEIEGPGRVVGQQLRLGGKQHLQHRQQEHRTGGEGLRIGLFRVEQAAGIVVGIGQPALGRFAGAQRLQLRAAEGQHVGAAEARAAEQHGKALHIALGLNGAEQGVPGGKIVRSGTVGKAAAQGQVHLADTFFVHGKTSCRWYRTRAVSAERRPYTGKMSGMDTAHHNNRTLPRTLSIFRGAFCHRFDTEP